MNRFRVTTPEQKTGSLSLFEVEEQVGIPGISGFIDHLVGAPSAENSRCPACNFSVLEFVATGLLGCPVCYVAFDRTLRQQVGSKDLVS